MKSLVFTYLLTYGGAALSLFRPWWGFLIYVCFAILKPDDLWYWAVPQGNYSRIVAIAFLTGWALHGFGSWRFGRGRLIILSLVGLFLWATLSAMKAPNQEVAWHFVEALAKIVLPGFAAITLIDSVAQIRQLAWVIVLTLGYIGFLENQKYLQGAFVERDNYLAHEMVVGAGLALFLSLQSEKSWQRWLASACCLMLAHAVLIHESRGAMLGLVVAGITCFLILEKKTGHYLKFTLVVIVVLALAGPQVRQRFQSTLNSKENRDDSAQSRLDLWRDMYDAAQRDPLFGLGPDHWPLVAHEYGWPPGKEGHGLWMQTLAEFGVPGVLFLGVFYGACLLRLLPLARKRQSTTDPALAGLACMVLPALVAFVVEAQFGSFKLMEAPFYVVLLGAGILKLSSATAVPQQWSAVRPVQAPATVRLTQSPSRPLVQPARALDNC
jgi:probable O-glycosylation ligase (exosortase A-associated)